MKTIILLPSLSGMYRTLYLLLKRIFGNGLLYRVNIESVINIRKPCNILVFMGAKYQGKKVNSDYAVKFIKKYSQSKVKSLDSLSKYPDNYMPLSDSIVKFIKKSIKDFG